MAVNQRYYSKAHHKNPKRVAAAKAHCEIQRARGRYDNDSTRRIRSSHLGYDCYATGKITGEAGKIRCLLKATRLPGHITHDIQAMLPIEMWWPERDHKAAHAMVDAILTFDLTSLMSWKQLWPTHDFGFENFMQIAERHLVQLHSKTMKIVQESNKLMEVEQRTDPSLPPEIPKPSKFPCAMTRCQKVGEVESYGCLLRLGVAWFEDGGSALSVNVRSIPSNAHEPSVLLSRAFVDLVDGQYEITEHYPGRYQAFGLSPRVLYMILGVKFSPSKAWKRLVDTAEKSSTPGTIERSEKIMAAVSTGDPNAKPPGPEQVSEDREVEEDEVDVRNFPAAPGG